MSQNWDDQYDVIIVGTGASGLTAAVTAEYHGMKTLVIEKLDKWGGSTAYSGGGLWIPNSYLMAEDGVSDSDEEALAYLEAIIEDVGTASSRARKEAYVKNAREMMVFLKDLGFEWNRAPFYPDYYPNFPGAKTGRTHEGKIMNSRKLGKMYKSMIQSPTIPAMPATTSDAALLPLATVTWQGFKRAMSVAGRMIKWGLISGTPLSLGRSLVGQLMYILQDRYQTPVWLSAPLKEIIMEDGKAVGVFVEKDGKTLAIRAEKGILLGAGGFPQNDAYRRKYQPLGSDWTSAAPGNTGDAIIEGEKVGGALAMMEEAWFGGSFIMNGLINFAIYERSFPGAIIVDHSGERYVNESAPYTDLGRKMLDREAEVGGAVPSWLILDGKHRKKYLFGMLPGGYTPKKYLKDGTFIKAKTISELAQKCRINEQNLQNTIKRFNSFAYSGIDEDFKRGEYIYDRYYSDYSIKPNSTLAPVKNAPFYAIKIYPGDLGTKGGLLTDEFARVLREDGSVIEGLYASGNNTASVMGKTYAGAGATIGPACAFSYIGMNHLANKK